MNQAWRSHGRVFVMTLALASIVRVAVAQDLEVEGYLYDHPLDVTLTTRDGRDFPIGIERKIVLAIRRPVGMAGSEVGVRARVHDSAGKPLADLARTAIPVTGPVLEVAYELPESLEGAAGAAVELLTGDGEVVARGYVDFAWHRLHGRVTDFAGDPRPARSFVVIESDQNAFVAGAETDSLGRYEMTVPARDYHTAFALDEGFGDTSLERYAHALTVEGDVELDFRIGEVEIYRLTAAATAEATVIADFSVFTIHHFVDRMVERLEQEPDAGMLEIITDPSFYPDLAVDDVEVLVDGRPIEVWTVETRASSLAAYGSDRHTRPYWVVEGKLPDGIGKGRHRLDVVVTAESESGGQAIVERGEASFHGLEVW